MGSEQTMQAGEASGKLHIIPSSWMGDHGVRWTHGPPPTGMRALEAPPSPCALGYCYWSSKLRSSSAWDLMAAVGSTVADTAW